MVLSGARSSSHSRLHIANRPLELKGLHLTTTLMLPPPAGPVPGAIGRCFSVMQRPCTAVVQSELRSCSRTTAAGRHLHPGCRITRAALLSLSHWGRDSRSRVSSFGMLPVAKNSPGSHPPCRKLRYVPPLIARRFSDRIVWSSEPLAKCGSVRKRIR